DVVAIPAGVGHCRRSFSDDLLVVGAYPDGADYDLRRGAAAEHDEVRRNIAAVPRPAADPVQGRDGPLPRLLRRAARRRPPPAAPGAPDAPEARRWSLQPIGVLATPFRSRAECPRNTRALDPAPLCHALLYARFVAGLRSLEGFSHLILLYWLDQAGPAELVF